MKQIFHDVWIINSCSSFNANAHLKLSVTCTSSLAVPVNPYSNLPWACGRVCACGVAAPYVREVVGWGSQWHSCGFLSRKCIHIFASFRATGIRSLVCMFSFLSFQRSWSCHRVQNKTVGHKSIRNGTFCWKSNQPKLRRSSPVRWEMQSPHTRYCLEPTRLGEPGTGTI